MRRYRSIFLEPNWAHTLYYGWREEASFPEVKILRKDFGPASRRLVLSESARVDRLGRALQEIGGHGLIGETIVHDFTGDLDGEELGPGGFREVERSRWMLNAATFVIDLTQDEEAIYERMDPDTKRRVKKADQAKVPVAVEQRPDGKRLRRFLNALNEMHRERQLQTVASATVELMFGDGRALLLSNESAQEGKGAYLMLYLAADKAFWLHGVGRGTSADSGQLLQWRAIQALKANGILWYDLGGVPPDPASGIRRYKQSFGGEFISLGNEFAATTPLMALARRAMSIRARFGL